MKRSSLAWARLKHCLACLSQGQLHTRPLSHGMCIPASSLLHTSFALARVQIMQSSMSLKIHPQRFAPLEAHKRVQRIRILPHPQKWVKYSTQNSLLIEEAVQSGLCRRWSFYSACHSSVRIVRVGGYHLPTHQQGKQLVHLTINNQQFTVRLDEMRQYNQAWTPDMEGYTHHTKHQAPFQSE